MAKCTISNGIETITGALKKTTEQVPKLHPNGVSKRKESELTGSFCYIYIRKTKKVPQNLHICKKSSIFVPEIGKYGLMFP
jgi:hypothetical protein